MAEHGVAERKVAGTLRVYRALAAAQLRSQTQYRASFAVEVAANALVSTLDLLAVLVLFRVTPALGGFTVTEAFLVAALSGLAFALADCAVGGTDWLPRHVRTGSFDGMLVRPLGTLPQLVVAELSFRRFGRLAQTSVALAVAVAVNDIAWSPATVVLLVVSPLAGAVAFGSAFVVGSTLAFWLVESGEVANAFTYGGRDLTAYPITVYGDWFRRVMAYAVPFAFVAYLPALALLDRPDPLGLPGWLRWCAVPVAAACAGAAGLVWSLGVRQYRSTGS